MKISFTRLERACRNRWQNEKSALSDKEFFLQRSMAKRLSIYSDRLENLGQRIGTVARYRLKLQNSQLQALDKSIQKSAWDFLQQQGVGLLHLQNRMELSDPERIFRKGYTRTEFEGKPIHKHLPKFGDEITTYTLKKSITSKVIEIDEHGEEKGI